MQSQHNTTRIGDILKLPEELRKNGFDYELIKRNDNKCLYSQNKGARIIAYELFKTKLNKTSSKAKLAELSGRILDISNMPEFYESFPSNEEFGKRAWTISNLNLALERFQNL